MNDKYTNQEEIVARTGSGSWEDVVEWFSGKSADEIEEECNKCWPADDNTALAQLIYNTL